METNRRLRSDTRGLTHPYLVAVLALASFIVFAIVIIFAGGYLSAVLLIFAGAALAGYVPNPWAKYAGIGIIVLGAILALIVASTGALALATGWPFLHR